MPYLVEFNLSSEARLRAAAVRTVHITPRQKPAVSTDHCEEILTMNQECIASSATQEVLCTLTHEQTGVEVSVLDLSIILLMFIPIGPGEKRHR